MYDFNQNKVKLERTKNMEIPKSQAVKIFEELGFATAGGWSISQLQNRISNLPEICEDVDTKTLDIKLQPLIESALHKIKDNKEVKVVADSQSEKKETSEPVKKVKEKVKKEKPVKVAKEKKAKKEKKAPVKRGEGVIATIIQCLAKPVTKEDILKTLVAKFPDRNKNGMETTVKCAVPSYLQTKMGLKILHKDGRYKIANKK